MPPILFTALQFPFTQLAYKLFPTPVANGIIAGAFVFCKYNYIIIGLQTWLTLTLQMLSMTPCIMRKWFPLDPVHR